VTDDMLVLTRDSGRWLAQPGPPRLKLYRDMADYLLGSSRDGIAMNSDTTKLIIPLDTSQCVTGAQAPIAVYILSDEEGRQQDAPVIRRLSPAAAFPRLLAHTAGHYPSDAARLRRQFEFATAVVQEIPISTLSYRRDKAEMVGLKEGVLADIARSID
jgi:hypothetical protein